MTDNHKSPPTKTKNGKSFTDAKKKKHPMAEVVGSSVVVSHESFSTPSTVSSRSSSNASSSMSPSSYSAASKASSNASTTKKRLIQDSESATSSTLWNIKKRLVLDGDNSPPKTKLAAYDVDWLDPSATMKECLKHTNIKNLPLTQEKQLTFLLGKFETTDLKVAFTEMIGKVGAPARKAFYPVPLRKDKVIQRFLELIYDGRSIIIDESKDAFR